MIYTHTIKVGQEINKLIDIYPELKGPNTFEIKGNFNKGDVGIAMHNTSITHLKPHETKIVVPKDFKLGLVLNKAIEANIEVHITYSTPLLV